MEPSVDDNRGRAKKREKSCDDDAISCPKCGTDFVFTQLACTRCGLRRSLFGSYGKKEQGFDGPHLQELWRCLQQRWSEQELHDELLAQARRSLELTNAARLYRAHQPNDDIAQFNLRRIQTTVGLDMGMRRSAIPAASPNPYKKPAIILLASVVSLAMLWGVFQMQAEAKQGLKVESGAPLTTTPSFSPPDARRRGHDMPRGGTERRRGRGQ